MISNYIQVQQRDSLHDPSEIRFELGKKVEIVLLVFLKYNVLSV